MWPDGKLPDGAGVYMIVRWHTRNRAVRGLFLVIAIAAPIIVGFSRAFRGMHHPIDVLAGVPIGIAAIVVVVFACRVAGAAIASRDQAAEAR